MLRGIQKSKEKTRTEPTILSARNFPVKSVQSSWLPTKYCFRNIHIYPYIPCTPFCSHCSCKPSHRMLREAQAAELGKNKRNHTISENCIQYVNSNSCFPLFSSDEEWWHAVTLPISWLGTGNAELAELPSQLCKTDCKSVTKSGFTKFCASTDKISEHHRYSNRLYLGRLNSFNNCLRKKFLTLELQTESPKPRSLLWAGTVLPCAQTGTQSLHSTAY